MPGFWRCTHGFCCVRGSQVCKLFSDYFTRKKDDHSLRRVLLAMCQAAKLAQCSNDEFAKREFSAYGDLLKQMTACVFTDAKFRVRASTCRALLLAYARSARVIWAIRHGTLLICMGCVRVWSE